MHLIWGQSVVCVRTAFVLVVPWLFLEDWCSFISSGFDFGWIKYKSHEWEKQCKTMNFRSGDKRPKSPFELLTAYAYSVPCCAFLCLIQMTNSFGKVANMRTSPYTTMLSSFSLSPLLPCSLLSPIGEKGSPQLEKVFDCQNWKEKTY